MGDCSTVTSGTCVDGEKDEDEEDEGNDPDEDEEDADRDDPDPVEDEPEDTEDRDESTACEREQDKEQKRDQLARKIADEIRGKGDWRRREYGGVIYYNTVTDAYRSDTGADIDRGRSSEVDFTISLMSNEIVAGLVHNHPRRGGSAPSEDDWDIADFLFGSGSDPVRANPDTFSHYILSGDNQTLYEFDNSDRSARAGKEKHSNDAQGECND